MKSIALIINGLLFASSALAQIGVEMPILNQPLLSASSNPLISFAPNLAEAWEFTNNSVTTNATVTNWIGQIQGTILTNGNASDRPTNSNGGLGFSGATGSLTNIPLTIGSNYTVTVFYNHDGYDGGNNNQVIGKNGGNFQLGHVFGDVNSEVSAWTLQNGSQSGGGSQFKFPNGKITDIAYSMSNNVAGGGVSTLYFWTNGVFQRTAGGESVSEVISAVGHLAGAFCFGHIQGIYVQTNFVATVVSTSNLHYWRTNYLTKGASP